MKPKYFFFNLEMALKNSDDSNIYAFINVSQIPTNKLVEIFKIDLSKDPNILEGYFLTKTMFRKNKAYLEKVVGQMNLDVFEYCLRQYVGYTEESIRQYYKMDLFE